jgi:hypothetical protein
MDAGAGFAIHKMNGLPKHFYRFLLLTTCLRGSNLKVSLKKEVVQKNEFM